MSWRRSTRREYPWRRHRRGCCRLHATPACWCSLPARCGHVIETDGGAAAGTVFNDDRAERRFYAIGPDAPDHVMHAARGRRHDEVNLLRRKGLRPCRKGCEARQLGCGTAENKIAPSHDVLPARVPEI